MADGVSRDTMHRSMTMLVLLAPFSCAWAPAGWMPSADGGAFAIEPCVAAAPAPTLHALHHGSSHDGDHTTARRTRTSTMATARSRRITPAWRRWPNCPPSSRPRPSWPRCGRPAQPPFSDRAAVLRHQPPDRPPSPDPFADAPARPRRSRSVRRTAVRTVDSSPTSGRATLA